MTEAHSGELVNGHSEDTQIENIEHWPTQKQVTTDYGIPARDLSRLVNRGAVRTGLVAGLRRFSPDDIEAHKANAEGQAAVGDQFVKMLKQEQDHGARIFDKAIQLLGPGVQLAQHYEKELARLQARVELLEGTHDTMLREKEKLISESHLRDLEIRQFEAKKERGAKVLGMISGVMPSLVSQIKETFGLAGNPKAKAALELLESLKGDESVSALLAHPDFFDAHQKHLLAIVLADDKPAASSSSEPVKDPLHVPAEAFTGQPSTEPEAKG